MMHPLTCRSLVPVVFLLLFNIPLIAGGIKGSIKDEKGDPLPFATIFVKQTGTGTTTNENGLYELALPSGTYNLVFQYVGYETVERTVTVVDSFIETDVVLRMQATMLQTVTIKAGKEDPAYTIMRKAIAKANYHRNQLDSYSARVYIKGAGELKDYPWLAKKQLEKEGIEKGRVYIQESVSDLQYFRPNKYVEKVISVYGDEKNGGASPNQFIYGSFYEPEIAETISPLSPKSFSYYRFEYLGTFKDRNYEISRIKVIPRSKGDNVIEGTIYIVENWWSLHSMDVTTSKLGIKFFIKAVYAPIEDKAWLPVSHHFRVTGKIFGFEFEGKYLATLSDYKIKVNPELYVEPEQMEVVDEALEKERAKEVEKKADNGKAKELQDRLASGKEITRKELKTLVKEYEKQERQQQDDPAVMFENEFIVDSAAYKKDSTYWASVRPVPLTYKEIKGYEKADSMAVIEKKKQEGDTVKASKHKGFQPWDIITGDSYKISKHSNFRIHMPFGGFNTVEGWHIIYKIGFGTVVQDTNRTRINITPTFRYAFSREKFTGNLNFTIRNKNYRFQAEGGRYVQQLNSEKPIHPIVNDLMTLFLEKNLIKLYERDYIDLFYRRKINPFLTFELSTSLSKRYELQNNTNWKLIDNKDVEGYTSNQPINVETKTTFPTHEAFVTTLGFQTRPWLKFRIRNGQKHEIHDSSPTFMFDYRKGFSDIFGSDVKFDNVELGFRHNFDLGVRAHIMVSMKGGMFLNSDQLFFMDYKHFIGNQTPVITTDPVGSYRLLDYYLYSTSDKYFTGSLHYQFRKFLFTSLPKVRLMGIRENIFVNYLATPSSRNYAELGYSIDGILRIFRLEAAASFSSGQYQDYGFRLGIATNIGVDFSD
jgi:hypothetical protein